MSKRTLNTVAIFVLGVAVGVGLYDVASDSDFETLMLVLASIALVLVALARREESAQ